MNHSIKKKVKRYIPIGVDQKITDISEKLDSISNDIENFRHDIFEKHDFRIDELKKRILDVEPYQPVYGINGVIDNPSRETIGRVEAIYRELENNVRGTKMLDIGSSLGYIPFYFCERGAQAHGWDFRPKNVEVSNRIKEINGIGATFYTKELNIQTVQLINIERYDVISILSVMHHIVAEKGMKYAQKLVKYLTEAAPILFFELAQKGEDPKLAWDKSLPENDLELFKDCSNIKIEKIGDFETHLSSIKRPLYKVYSQHVRVNGKNYQFSNIRRYAYRNSPVGLQRRYYHSPEKKYFIKEYILSANDKENKKQIINELNFLLQHGGANGIPGIIDFSLLADRAILVLDFLQGDLLFESTVSNPQKVAIDLINFCANLEQNGWFHNDIRSWNVIYNKRTNKATLIDFGMIAPKQTENNVISLIWTLSAMLEQKKEGPEVNKSELPPYSDRIASNEFISKLYKIALQKPDISFNDLKSRLIGA